MILAIDDLIERNKAIAITFIGYDNPELFHQYVQKSVLYRNKYGSLKDYINTPAYEPYMKWRDSVVAREVCEDNGLFPYVLR